MYNNRLGYCRRILGLRQIDVAEMLGVAESTISNWENGYGFIPLRKLICFSNYSHYSLDFICGLKNINERYPSIINIDEKVIGNNLKKFRRSTHLSQLEFAGRCGIPQTTYSHYEIGYKLITTLNLYSICKVYNVSMDYLLGKY